MTPYTSLVILTTSLTATQFPFLSKNEPLPNPFCDHKFIFNYWDCITCETNDLKNEDKAWKEVVFNKYYNLVAHKGHTVTTINSLLSYAQDSQKRQHWPSLISLFASMLLWKWLKSLTMSGRRLFKTRQSWFYHHSLLKPHIEKYARNSNWKLIKNHFYPQGLFARSVQPHSLACPIYRWYSKGSQWMMISPHKPPFSVSILTDACHLSSYSSWDTYCSHDNSHHSNAGPIDSSATIVQNLCEISRLISVMNWKNHEYHNLVICLQIAVNFDDLCKGILES